MDKFTKKRNNKEAESTNGTKRILMYEIELNAYCCFVRLHRSYAIVEPEFIQFKD